MTPPQRLRTLAVLALLGAGAPLNLAVTLLALLTHPTRGDAAGTGLDAAHRETVLISGAKMTKALHLARAFSRAGHRVVLVESRRYRHTGHRFSRAVDAFHVIPKPSHPDYVEALVDVVRREGVDTYVPVCSPAAAEADARAKARLEEYCRVFHFDPQTLSDLDDKARFCASAGALGLPVPDAHRIEDGSEVTRFDWSAGQPPYILKSIAYDPVRRLDLTRLPRPSRAETEQFVATLPISPENPWVLQSFITGPEYCTHSTVRHGRVQLHCCCRSSAFQLNYEMVDEPEIEAWVRRFVGERNLTGQVSLDFIRGEDGHFYAIECNPRTHSAITMFYDHPGVAAAYLEDTDGMALPTRRSRPTYWLYHELWRALSDPRRTPGALRRILTGKEAVFAWDDPLPFFILHHVQIPYLLIDNLRRGVGWSRIDFNIGKLVEPGGD